MKNRLVMAFGLAVGLLAACGGAKAETVVCKADHVLFVLGEHSTPAYIVPDDETASPQVWSNLSQAPEKVFLTCFPHSEDDEGGKFLEIDRSKFDVCTFGWRTTGVVLCGR